MLPFRSGQNHTIVCFFIAAASCTPTSIPEHANKEQRDDYRAIGPLGPQVCGSWGPAASGLQCQACLPAFVEQNATITGIVKCRSVVDEVPDGIKAINPCWDMCSNLRLRLTDTTGKNEYLLDADTRTFGPPAHPDDGRTAIALNGTSIPDWSVTFSPLRSDAPPPVGRYEAVVLYEQSSDPNPGWRLSHEDWSKSRFWHGSCGAGPSSLEIVLEVARTVELRVPRRLRLEKKENLPGFERPPRLRPETYLVTTYQEADAESIAVPSRNGHWIATTVERRDGSRHFYGGPIRPGDELDQWFQYYGGNIAANYTIRVIESCESDPWMVGPGACGYKALWEANFSLTSIEKEISDLEPVPIKFPMGPFP